MDGTQQWGTYGLGKKLVGLGHLECQQVGAWWVGRAFRISQILNRDPKEITVVLDT